MRPPGSIPVKVCISDLNWALISLVFILPLQILDYLCILFQDYAIETPLKKLSSTPERDTLHEVTIDFSPNSEIATIRFVLKVLII